MSRSIDKQLRRTHVIGPGFGLGSGALSTPSWNDIGMGRGGVQGPGSAAPLSRYGSELGSVSFEGHMGMLSGLRSAHLETVRNDAYGPPTKAMLAIRIAT